MGATHFQRGVSGVVCALAAGMSAAGASGQVVNESAKLLASDGFAFDHFGGSVSVWGDVAVVGASGDDDNSFQSGSAYVFRWNGSAWVQEQKLLPSDGAFDDFFGVSVSVSGDVALVGAYGDDQNGLQSGSAYVFQWNGSAWVQEQKLLPSDGAFDDFFGVSVSVSGDVAVVGASGDDDNGSFSGSAYVFRWNGSAWEEEQKLLASDGAAGDVFGFPVSVSGDVAVMGAHGDDDNGKTSGSAYVFRRNGSAWEEEQKLLASDGAAANFFGKSVSVSDDIAVVGAPEYDGDGTATGSAYVFRWSGSAWVEEQKLLASDGAARDEFGDAVSVLGVVALVGAVFDDDSGPDSGSAYLFRWNGSAWVEEQKLLASDGAAANCFGDSVFVSGGVAVVGAPRDDENRSDSGAAYVFNLGPAVGACCDGLFGTCFVGLQGECGCEQCIWTKGVSCADTDCFAAPGACCDRGTEDPAVAICTITTLEACNCEKCSWTKGVGCEAIDCPPNFVPIPAVSEWGLAILALLLLIGGKLYFGRREAATA